MSWLGFYCLLAFWFFHRELLLLQKINIKTKKVIFLAPFTKSAQWGNVSTKQEREAPKKFAEDIFSNHFFSFSKTTFRIMDSPNIFDRIFSCSFLSSILDNESSFWSSFRTLEGVSWLIWGLGRPHWSGAQYSSGWPVAPIFSTTPTPSSSSPFSSPRSPWLSLALAHRHHQLATTFSP